MNMVSGIEFSHINGLVLLATVTCAYKFWVEVMRRPNRLFESYKPGMAQAYKDRRLLFMEYSAGLCRRLSLLCRFLGLSRTFSLLLQDACLERCKAWDGVETRFHWGGSRDLSPLDSST